MPLRPTAVLLTGLVTSVCVAAFGARHVDAQAPSAPAPPAASDSIYRLAVDSTAYREYPYVYLLDDGVVRCESDGRCTRTYRQVVQLLKERAVREWAERRFSYQPERQKLDINWIRVVRPSGEVVSDKPVQSQESDVPAAMTDPVYTNTKVIRYSLSNVAAGTLVDISWTIQQLDPFLAGNFFHGWNITMAYPAQRSRFVLDLPASLKPNVVERHLAFRRQETVKGDRRIYTWATRDVVPVKAEPFAPDSSIPAMAVRVSAPLTWGDIGRWYDGLAKERYALTPAVAARVDAVVRGARTGDDTLRALHRWIARDLRYVSIALGLGGYQPRFPEATVQTGYGDCKDKATLFIAAARHLGLAAYPVLLHNAGVRETQLPALEQFNHVIAAVPDPGRRSYTYLDLTTADFPVGTVPTSYQGEFGLVIRPDGSTEEIRFPEDSVGLDEQRLVGELGEDGRIITARYTATARGRAEYGMRRAFAEPLDSARRANLGRNFARSFPGAKVDTVIAFDGRDWSATPRLEVALRDGVAAKAAGASLIVGIPGPFRGRAASYRRVLEDLEQRGPRTLPIDAGKVAAPVRIVTELRFTLPAGWTAQLPKNVAARSAFGTYTAEYAQNGRELRIYKTLEGAKGVHGADKVGALVEWLRAVTQDDAEFVALTRGS